MICYRCLDSLNRSICLFRCFFLFFVWFFFTPPLVEINGCVRESAALSSCADASDLPREDDVVVTADQTLIRTVQLGHGVARIRSSLFPEFIKVSEVPHLEDLDTFPD